MRMIKTFFVAGALAAASLAVGVSQSSAGVATPAGVAPATAAAPLGALDLAAWHGGGHGGHGGWHGGHGGHGGWHGGHGWHGGGWHGGRRWHGGGWGWGGGYGGGGCWRWRPTPWGPKRVWVC